MGTIRNGALLSILALGLCLAPAFADHEVDTTGRPAPNPNFRPNAKLRSLEELKKLLNEAAPKGEAWYAAAHEVLETLVAQAIADKKEGKQPKNPMDWAKELEGEERQKAFEAVVTANLKEQSELKALAQNVSDQSPLGIASRYEMAWRLKDPHVKFVSKYFSRRPESAIEDAMQLIGIGQMKDEDAAALVNKMMSLVNKKQRTALRDFLKAEESKPEKESELNKDVVRKLLEAVEVTLDPKAASTEYQKKFATLYEQTLKDNAAFHDLVQRARTGTDPQAVKLLRDSYKPEDLIDFIGGQLHSGNDGVAVGLAQVVADKKDDGTSYLNLKKSNSAFSNNGEGMTVYLGKTDQELRAALEAVYNTPADAHNPGAMLFKPDYENGLQLVTLNPGPPAEGTKRYYAEPNGQNFKLKETTEGVPTVEVGKQRISVPLPKPPPPTEQPADKPDGGQTPPENKPEQTPPGPEITEAKLTELVNSNTCQKCHATNGTTLTPSGKSLGEFRINDKTFQQAVEHMETSDAMKNNPGVKGIIGTPDAPGQLRAWAKAQQSFLEQSSR